MHVIFQVAVDLPVQAGDLFGFIYYKKGVVSFSSLDSSDTSGAFDNYCYMKGATEDTLNSEVQFSGLDEGSDKKRAFSHREYSIAYDFCPN